MALLHQGELRIKLINVVYSITNHLSPVTYFMPVENEWIDRAKYIRERLTQLRDSL